LEAGPDYIKTIPLDPNTEHWFCCRQFLDEKSVEQGFLLNSISEDGRDDGGVVPTDALAPDLVLRVIHKPGLPMMP
jgi:hypothetical protein